MSANLANNLKAAAWAHPSRRALVLDDIEYSYSRLDDAAARLASLLRGRGIVPGDRVGLMIPNVPEFAVLYYGILRAGAVVVPMNVQFKRREVAYHLGDAGARVLFAWTTAADAAAPGASDAGAECVHLGPGILARLIADYPPMASPVERFRDDTAVILYTSGTTGRPKGAQLTHGNLARNAEVARGLFQLDHASLFLGVLPLFHSFGQTCALNATILAGGTLTLVTRFDPGKVLETIERERATVFAGVPTMYSALLNHPQRERFEVSSLRLCVSGGAALPVELLRGFEAAFGCVILEGYGLSETSPIASFNHPDRPRKPGSIGTPIEGVEMRIIDEVGDALPPGAIGEIAIRGHNVMKGYWQQPDATAEVINPGGWFCTGDLGYVDDDGYYYIVDRKKEMIIRGGYNVYPREIEEILYQHPAVVEAAVVGIPDAAMGEEVGAAVVVAAGYDISPREVLEFVRAQVAAYKCPRRVWFVDTLPKTATGKILKRSIERPSTEPDPTTAA